MPQRATPTRLSASHFTVAFNVHHAVTAKNTAKTRVVGEHETKESHQLLWQAWRKTGRCAYSSTQVDIVKTYAPPAGEWWFRVVRRRAQRQRHPSNERPHRRGHALGRAGSQVPN